MKDIPNVTICDNGACFMIQVDGLQVKSCLTLGDAWNYIVWMYKVVNQKFTVGKKEIPVSEWIDLMKKLSFID